MYCAYLDESGENEDTVFSVGGFAGHEDEWKSLEPQWLAALPAGIDYFHATDCFGRRGQFRGMDIPERTALLDALTDLIVAHKIQLVAGVINVPAYEKVAPKFLDNEFLGNKYAAAFGVPVDWTCQLQNSPNNPFPEPGGELCAFFIEEHEAYTPSAQRVFYSMRHDSRLWWRERIGNLTPGSKIGPGAIPLLQVGDLGAFLGAKHIAQPPDGRIPWRKYYEKLRNARRITAIVHVRDTDINKLHEMNESIKREQAEGRNYWDEI